MLEKCIKQQQQQQTTKQKQKQTNNNNKTTQVFQNFGSVGKWQTNIFFGGPIYNKYLTRFQEK